MHERTVPASLALAGVALMLVAFASGCGAAPGADGGGSAASAGAPSASRTSYPPGTAVATFAAGCFWGVEARFAAVAGVIDAESGYTGGTTEDPTYEEVCSDTTGHAEAVRLRYDPDVVSYEQLVEAFYAMHDPTTEDRQGPDVGSQYRSAIFFHSPRQEAIAHAVTDRLERAGVYGQPIVTEIVPAGPFWRAEEYHQDYYGGAEAEACPT
jgi:peptide-methionine (S)-S-oxide reductase